MVDNENVKVVKLVTGETVFAEVTEKDGSVHLKNPLTLVVERLKDGGVGVGFKEWLPYCHTPEANILRTQVIFMETPAADFVVLYAEQYNKIVLPDKTIVA